MDALPEYGMKHHIHSALQMLHKEMEVLFHEES